MSLQPCTRLGSYEVTAKIGEGGRRWTAVGAFLTKNCLDQPLEIPPGAATRWSAAACGPADRPGDVVSHLAMRSR